MNWIKTLLLVVFAFACSPAQPYVWGSTLPSSAEASGPLLRAGDRVQVVVHGQEAMSGEFEVRPGGEVVLPVAGRVQAMGLLPEQLAGQVQERLKGVLATPLVTVVLASRRPLFVSVLGEVRTAGRFEMREGEGLLDALARGGGLTPFADPDSIFVVRRSPPGPRIRFRFRDLAGAVPSSTRFALRDGDVVVVE